MKHFFKKNYLWAVVVATLVVSVLTPAISQAQLTDSSNSVIPESQASTIDKGQINRARDAVCGSNQECKSAFDDVVRSNGLATDDCGGDRLTGSSTGGGTQVTSNEPYCKAGQRFAQSVYSGYDELTRAGGQCSAPMAASAVRSCLDGYYRGLRGLSNNCSGSIRNKCTAAFNKGKTVNDTGRSSINVARNESGTTTPAATSSEEDGITCSDSDALSWIICPVLEGINVVINQMDNAINNLLTVDTNKLFGTGNASANDKKVSNAYYTAWATFRTFALGFVVIMALIVIISTAFGYEILDAYTIRKVLPRLLIAIIGIVLSWSILSFLVGITNDLGNGIRAIIYAPFNGLEVGEGNSINFDDGIGPILSVLGIGTILVMTSMGVLAMAGVALLAVLCAFLVLVLRELVIIVLVITAPIGIAMLILPNTRKYWQFWQNTLTIMLLAFPIIAAMIATGKVFALVTLSFDDNDLIYNMIALVAYILPYFMLPFAFKFAGGVLGTLAGGVSARAGGLSDGMRKYTAGKRQESIHGMKTGQRFNEAGNFVPGSARMARRFNRTGGAVGTGMRGHFGIGERGRQAISQQQELNAMESVMKNPRWNTMNNNDDALHAATWGSADEAMTNLQKRDGWDKTRASAAVAAARSSIGFGRGQQIAAARQLVSTGTGYDSPDDMIEVLGRVSAGNSSTASSLAGFANSEAKRVGRADLAPSYGTLNAAVQNAGDTRFGEGGSKSSTELGAKAPSDIPIMQNAWESVSLYQHGNGKPTAIKNFAKYYEDRLANGTQEQQVQALTFFKDLQNMKSGANGAVSSEINKILSRTEADIKHVGAQNVTPASRPGSGGVESIDPAKNQTMETIAASRARSYRDPSIENREQQ